MNIAASTIRKSLLKTSARILLQAALIPRFLLLSGPAWSQSETPEAWRLKARPTEGLSQSLLASRVNAVESSRSGTGRLYGATARGLFSSDDGGQSWAPVPVDRTEDAVFSVAVHPQDPGVVLLGRRDGLWRSHDGGGTWKPLGAPTPRPYVPLAIAISETEPEVIYVATSREGVFKSDDGGREWMRASGGLPQARAGGRPDEIRTLAIHPRDPDTAYIASERHGIYRTTDGGASWRPFNRGLPFPFSQSMYPPRLAFHPEGHGTLYVLFSQRIHSHLVKNRLYGSSDGKEWLPLEVDLPANIPFLGIAIDREERAFRLWAEEGVWDLPLPGSAAPHK